MLSGGGICDGNPAAATAAAAVAATAAAAATAAKTMKWRFRAGLQRAFAHMHI